MAWMDGLVWPRETDRLSLRPALEADLEPLWRIRRQESVGQWMGDSSTVLDEFVTRAHELDRLGTTVIIQRDGEIIGDLSARIGDAWAQGEVADQAVGVEAELGWVIDPGAEGHGYATEAVAELVRICFEDLGLRRVTALCFAENAASWRLMERIGMRREAYNVKDSLHRSGEWMDGMLYALLAEEWREQSR